MDDPLGEKKYRGKAIHICICSLSDIPSILSQVIIIRGVKQVLKLAEAQTKEMNLRKRMYVCIIFWVSGCSCMSFFRPSLF